MNTKLLAALVIVGVLAVAVVGLVSAQIAAPNPNSTTANGAPYNGFFGWMGRMMGYSAAPYYGTGTQAIQGQPANITITNPNTGTTTTYQGYFGYGGCMRGFFP